MGLLYGYNQWGMKWNMIIVHRSPVFEHSCGALLGIMGELLTA
jgi:hypothetical protein